MVCWVQGEISQTVTNGTDLAATRLHPHTLKLNLTLTHSFTQGLLHPSFAHSYAHFLLLTHAVYAGCRSSIDVFSQLCQLSLSLSLWLFLNLEGCLSRHISGHHRHIRTFILWLHFCALMCVNFSRIGLIFEHQTDLGAIKYFGIKLHKYHRYIELFFKQIFWES